MSSTTRYETICSRCSSEHRLSREYDHEFMAQPTSKMGGTAERVKHTSGPWFTDIRTVNASDHHVVTVECSDGMGRVRLADCGPVGAIGSICDLENGANARLIAASPEMLRALEDALESLKRLPDVDGAYRVTCIQQCEAAIHRAKGE